ncbi:MAG TPA: hypothetical protein VEV82_06425 [Actinomycetota bacterium]|nr:hypothetical protein [Actinomycetota bacterium]
MAEDRLRNESDSDTALYQLRRVASSLDEPEQKVIVYLRTANALEGLGPEEIGRKFGAEVEEALELLTQQKGESLADVVMRAASSPMTYEIVANDIAEEMDRIEQARHTEGSLDDATETRRELLILSQALLDRVGRGDDNVGDPTPVTREDEDQVVTVYQHPVHGDIVVLVKPRGRDEGAEDWVLINGQDKSRVTLELVADKLKSPLREELVPWLESHDIAHRVYVKDEGEPPGGAARG